MIKLLVQRGEAIKNKNQAKILEVERQINQTKEKAYNCHVVGVFVTYEKESDIRKFVLNDKTPLQLFGEHIQLKRAKEP